MTENKFSFLVVPTSPAVETDEDRYAPNITYYWDGDQPEPGHSGDKIYGHGCHGGDCLITCDYACTCQLGPAPDELTQNCNVVEMLPYATIPNPNELVVFGSASQDPDSIAIRCTGTFIDRCSKASFSDGYFVRQEGYGFPGYDYAQDFSDCNADDGEFCYIACDPRCSCSETKDGESGLECATATAPPTSAPTVAPAPTKPTPPTTSGGFASGKISFGGLIVVLIVSSFLEI